MEEAGIDELLGWSALLKCRNRPLIDCDAKMQPPNRAKVTGVEIDLFEIIGIKGRINVFQHETQNGFVILGQGRQFLRSFPAVY
jgi:hypothetical protein